MVIVKVQTAGAGAGVGLVELPQPAPTRAAATRSSRASAIRRGSAGCLASSATCQASSFVTSFPCTSVSRKSRPWNRYVSFSWSIPNSPSIVA